MEYQKLLLDDLDAERLADNFLLFNYHLFGDLSRKVVLAIKVIEAGKRRNTVPVIERLIAAS